MKKLLVVAVLVAAVTQDALAFEPGLAVPTNAYGRNGAGTRQLPGSNPATWAPKSSQARLA